MSSRFFSSYYKSNSPQRPGIPGRSDSYDPAKMIPGAYPEDRHTTYPSTIDVQVVTKLLGRVPHTHHIITQTINAPGIQTEGEVVHNVEGIAAEVNHDLTNPEKSFTTPHPKQQTTHKLKDALHQLQGDVTTVNRELPTLSKTSPDVLLSESFGDMRISDKPTTLPSALQDEYYYSFAMVHDMDVDPLNLSEVVYVDTSGIVVPGQCGEERSLEVRDFERDYASDRARGGYVPGDGSVAVGHGGVTYNRFGRGGILPGYPTQEGMSKLIIDRMRDDQLRLAAVDNRTSSSVPAAISRSTNSSEGYPTSLPSTRNIGIQDSGPGSGKETRNERTVPCLDFRIIEERRETPLFETDRPTAPGKFEATPISTTSRSNQEGQNPTLLVVPGSGSFQEERSVHSFGSRAVKEPPVFKTGPTATEATFQPDSRTILNKHERGSSRPHV